ncbi:unnamed protein product, partial [Prorocentrum cordatum]
GPGSAPHGDAARLRARRARAPPMGVPGFHRWAAKQVPGLTRPCAGGKPIEVDHLHLDFNAAVHRCLTAWSGLGGEERLFALLEAYVLLILGCVRPTELLFVALDGVAPRAKMNQQRARRFREEGGISAAFDRNAVTPGTEFMARLGAWLLRWAEAAARGEGSWVALRGVTVVVSGADDPGEGEHKIMEVIRAYRDKSHCLFSNDADLIFLGLVSGARSVILLRESPLPPGRDNGVPAVMVELLEDDYTGADSDDGSCCGGLLAESDAIRSAMIAQVLKDFDVSELGLLRSWLLGLLPEGCGEDRRLLDFAALCCLAGNDFLPQASAINVFEGGIDQLIEAYTAAFSAAGAGAVGHLVDQSGSLILPAWREVLRRLAVPEAESLLESAGLGRRSPSPPPADSGGDLPRPPSDDWDGLSVLVRGAPPHTSGADVRAALAKQGCQVQAVYNVRPKGGVGHATAWVARLADARSAVMTLVSCRKVRGTVLDVSWVDPRAIELAGLPQRPLEPAAGWREVLERSIRESFEYWLGPKNLPTDGFLRRQVLLREDRFVPLRVFAAFNRLRTWCHDLDRIATVLKGSETLEVGEVEVVASVGGQAASEPAVRAVVDHSVRPRDGPERLARQRVAARCAADGDLVQAALVLKDDYYAQSGPCPPGMADTEECRVRAYLAGIQWVVSYYTQGCPSWTWFYPSHFPPLCASLYSALSAPGAGDGVLLSIRRRARCHRSSSCWRSSPPAPRGCCRGRCGPCSPRRPPRWPTSTPASSRSCARPSHFGAAGRRRLAESAQSRGARGALARRGPPERRAPLGVAAGQRARLPCCPRRRPRRQRTRPWRPGRAPGTWARRPSSRGPPRSAAGAVQRRLVRSGTTSTPPPRRPPRWRSTWPPGAGASPGSSRTSRPASSARGTWRWTPARARRSSGRAPRRCTGPWTTSPGERAPSCRRWWGAPPRPPAACRPSGGRDVPRTSGPPRRSPANSGRWCLPNGGRRGRGAPRARPPCAGGRGVAAARERGGGRHLPPPPPSCPSGPARVARGR